MFITVFVICLLLKLVHPVGLIAFKGKMITDSPPKNRVSWVTLKVMLKIREIKLEWF